MANDEWDSVFGNATQNGRADLDAVINPGKYTSNINNPLAKKLLTAYSALKAGVALPRMAGTAGDIGAIVAGAAGAGQQMQAQNMSDIEMAPLSSISPKLAEAFPEVADMPSKQAYDLIGKMQTYFSTKLKGAALDAEDVPAIKASLMAKGFSDQEANKYAGTFVGQTWDVVKNIPKSNALGDMSDAQPELVRMANGMQAYKIRTRSGYRYQIVPGQILTESDKTRLALVKQARTATDRIIEALSSDRGTELMLKAGNSWKKLSNIADTDAQNLAKDIFLAADARARIVTGAAMNKEEMDKYFNEMVSAYNTKAANISNVSKEQSFFDDYLHYLSYGKNLPQEDKSTPAPKPVSKGLDIKSASVSDILKAAGGGK